MAGVTVMERSSISEISRLVERSLANCVNRPAGDIKLTVAEWHRQLSQYNSIDLHCALDEHFQSSQWWPTVHDIIRHIRIKIAPPQLKSWQADREPFERDGRSRDEEIAHRARVIAGAWRVARAENPEVETPDDKNTGTGQSKGASQSDEVSADLYHSCAARRARGDATCYDGCFRAGVGVRSCAVDLDMGIIDGDHRCVK